jgi:hypothetical protein
MCVKLFENPVFHDRSKHVEIKYHYIRDMMQRKIVHMQYLPTHEQIADIIHQISLVKDTSLVKREC